MNEDEENKGTPPSFSQDLGQSNIPSPSFQEKGDEEEDAAILDIIGDTERTGSNSGHHPTALTMELIYEELQEIRKEVKETKKILGIKIFPMQWRKIGAQCDESVVPAPPKETTVFKLPEDMYSILASWKWKTRPVFYSVLVVAVQILLLVLLMVDILGNAKLKTWNVFDVPHNVKGSVRAAQLIAVIIALCSQSDLRVGIAGIFQGAPDAFKGDDNFRQMTRLQWHISYFLRFFQGFLSLVVSWILIMRAPSVAELLLNFLSISFISNLDDLFFALARLRYLGQSTLRCTEAITMTEFYRREERKPYDWLGLIGVFLLMFVGWVIIFYQQTTGVFSAETIFVEFGDETVPSLGLYNGCYHIDKSSRRVSRPLQFVSTAQGGTFAYCSAKNKWAFFDRSRGGDECSHILAQSEETTTFNILEIGKIQWFSQADLPIDFFKLTEVKSKDQCGKNVFESSLQSCKKLEFWRSDSNDDDLSSRSQSDYNKLDVSGRSLLDFHDDSTLSHAIYASTDMTNSSPEVVFFTGRRWVVTKAGIFPTNNTAWGNNASMIQEFFYEDRTFQVKEQGSKWVALISEEVDSVKDQGTPLGLRWFYPLYKDTSDDESSFPGADLARPYGSILRCASCDDDTNPCEFEGTCNENDGTCACANGAYGNLCRRRPLGDGECHPYFNTADHSYDGGDCCASTCKGKRCGIIPSFNSNPFSIAKNIPFLQISQVENFGTKFPDGIGSFSDFQIGYDCKDPNLASFIIEISNLNDVNHLEVLEGIACQFGSISVQCNGKSYLQTPQLIFANESDCSESYTEPVHVPYGAKCKITIDDMVDKFFPGSMYSIALYYGNSTKSVPIKKDFRRDNAEIAWKVPSSKCLTETLSRETLSIFNGSSTHGQAIQELSDDSADTNKCSKQERDLLREKYFLFLLNQSVAIKSSSLGKHPCQGWGTPAVMIECDKEKSITSLVTTSGCNSTENSCTLPSEIGFLSRLNTLILAGMDLQGSLPSELGNLQELNQLWLHMNSLTGPIPSELGNLQELTQLWLFDNSLTGSIPSELGNLQALDFLVLLGNQLTGSVPWEIANLSSLQDCFLIPDTAIATNKFQDGTVPDECKQDFRW